MGRMQKKVTTLPIGKVDFYLLVRNSPMDHGGCGEAAAAVIQYEGDHGCGDEVVAAVIRANRQSSHRNNMATWLFSINNH
jgi:hypothetical protein